MRHNLGSRLWWGGVIGLVIMLVFLAFTDSASSSLANSNTSLGSQGKDPRIAALTKGTTFLADIPETLPANGVSVEHGHIILHPLTTAQSKLVVITHQQALELAHKQFQETSSFTITIMLLASFTNIDTVPIDSSVPVDEMKNIPAWIVVYISTSPMSLPGGPMPPPNTPVQPSPTYYHFNIALNAHTGAYLCGFFTP